MSELPRLGADQLRLVHAVRGSVRVEQALEDDLVVASKSSHMPVALTALEAM